MSSRSESFKGVLQRQIAANASRTFATVWSSAKGIETSLSFGAWGDAVAAGAANLSSIGVKPGDRIALLSKGVLDFYICVMSAQYLQATPVALNWRQSPDNLVGMLRDTAVAALLVGAPYHALGQELFEQRVETLKTLAAIDDAPHQLTRWSWAHKPRAPLAATGGDRSDEAIVFFTSGSTSLPKAILHTNATLLWTAEHFVFPTPKMVTTLCFMPNFHVLMCFQNFLLPFARGVGCSIHGGDATDAITAQLLLNAAAALKPTTIDTVPFIMTDWSSMSAEDLAPLAACAAVRSGGAPLNAAVAERLVLAGVHVQTHYGQTEAPGMQLLSVPGTAPSELAIFDPPWTVVEIKLDNHSDEGELLLRGCGGSSPGILKDGRLVPGSSRTGADGWHHTGDIFRRVQTQSGHWGLKYVMRNDDTILLSTGEMFNPLPMEAAIVKYAVTASLPVSRLVILGQDRPAPFLVVEMSPGGGKLSTSDIWPGVEQANLAEVEYARIKTQGYVLVLDPGIQLPHSAKGNVIRPKAEAMCAERLNQMTVEADEELAEALDWDSLLAKARAAGFESVETYVSAQGSSALADIGVDSLGIATIMNRGQREADRISDNVKAWTVTAIVMSHWYEAFMLVLLRAGVLATFYSAKALNSSGFQAVSYGVQFTGTIFTLTDAWSLNGMMPVMIPLMASVGHPDSIRDGIPERKVKLGRREATMVFLIILFKCIVMPYSYYVYDHRSWRTPTISQPFPLSVVWFVYSLLWYRVFVWSVQQFFLPKTSKYLLLLACALWLFITNEAAAGGDGSCSICVISWGWMPPGINGILAFIFDPETYLMVKPKSTDRAGLYTSPDSWRATEPEQPF